MELITYLRFLYTLRYFLLAGVVIGGALSSLVAVRQPDQYEVATSLYVKRQAEEVSTQFFTYEGYYANQTAAAYTDTAVLLVDNLDVLRVAAGKAGLSQDEETILALRNQVMAEKASPQTISLTTTLANRDEAVRFSDGVAQAVAERTTALNTTSGDTRLAVSQVDEEPVVMVRHAPLALYAVAGGLFGLILVSVLGALWRYVRAWT